MEEGKKKNVHKGHRQRLKNKVRENGLKSLSVHEALELLLTYSIPQKDTNGLAHNLLIEYGNFANVLDAGYENLCKTLGVGEETALFLSILPQFFEIYKSCKAEAPTFALRNTQECVSYFRNNFEIRNKEFLYIVCLNKLKRVIKTVVIEGDTDCRINLDMQYITSKITGNNVDAIVVFHTHPHGNVLPSNDDVITTQNLLNLCCLIQVKMYDHIILNETDAFSFSKDGNLATMLQNINLMHPTLDASKIKLQQQAVIEFKERQKPRK